MSFINNFISAELISAIGWTIIHSIWQIAAIAFCLAFLMVLLRRHSSTLRYIIAATAMASIVIFAIITFFNYYSIESFSNTLNYQDQYNPIVPYTSKLL